MKRFFDTLQKLSTDELKSLAVLCGGASLLVAVALVLSGSVAFLPQSWRLAIGNIHQNSATANAAAAFLSAGSQTYIVPSGITNLTVFMWGGGGYSTTGSCYASCNGYTFCSYGGPGGGGGYTSANITVTPGQQLTVVVGGVAGYSGVFSGTTPSQATALVVAGAGGNAGGGSCTGGNPGCGASYSCSGYIPSPAGGPGGGLSGGSSYNATGGTQTAGGTGCNSGGALTGGGACSGGAGGAGWYGGGSGATIASQTYSGGAGGAGYCSPTVSNCSIVSGSGSTAAMSQNVPSGGVGNANNQGAVIISTAQVSLTANPSAVASGGTSVLSWVTNNGVVPNSCTLTGPNGTVGSGGLGGDASGGGTNWTVNNLSSADQVADTPSNSFATLNQMAYYAAGKGTVTAGGLAVSGGSWGAVAPWQLSAGKWYWEYTPQTSASGQYPMLGIFKDATSGFGSRQYPGNTNDLGIGYLQDGRVVSAGNYLPVRLSSFQNGDVIGTAYDADTGKLYFSKNGQWQNNDNFIPVMTAATTNGVTMSASTYYTTGYEAWRAGDRTTNFWYTYSHVPSVASPDWLQVDLGSGKTAASYSVQNYSSVGSYDPTNFKLQGSPDASTWTTLDTESNVAWTQGSQEQYFTIPSGNRASYRYYRLYVTGAGTVPAPTGYLIVDEFGLYPEGSASPSDGTSYVGIVRGGAWPGLASAGLTAVNFGQGGAPSTVFGDSSSYGHALTVGGTAQVSTMVSKFGGGSGYFNANSSYLTTPSTPGLTPSGDFTIDLWAYPTTVSGSHGLVSKGNYYDSYLIYQNAGTFTFYASSAGSAWDIAGGVSMGPATLNTWTHLAVVRSGTIYYLFNNGTLQGTFTSATPLWTNGYALAVGADEQGIGAYFQGYIDEVRVSNTARWTTTFTPPAAAYSSDANTLLLLHMEDAKSLLYSAGAGGYFAYPPPSGYQALSTSNLPTPVTAQPGQYFAAATYTGNGGTQTVNGINFQPDIVWIKNRSTTYWNTLADSVRGTNSDLFTNSTSAATTNDANGWVSALNATGFTVGGQCVASPPQTNLIGNSYISWAWKKSPTDGVDIVTYTGDGAGTHVLGHALGTTPDTIIVKRTDGTGDWYVWSSAMRPGEFTKLDTTDAATMSNTPFATDLIPVMTGATTNGVTMSASHEYPGQPAWYAGDKNPGTYWQSYPYSPSSASPEWLTTDLGSGRAVGAYSVQVYGLGLGNDPVDLTLQGSNDNNIWTVLDTEASVSWIVGQTQTFAVPLANQGSYRYYKVNVTRIDNANSTLIAEFNLWPAGTVPTATTFTVGSNLTNSLNASGGQYTAYLFSNRDQFQKTGRYVGNGSNDGPFVYTGFKPKYVMIKRTDSTGNWVVVDDVRDPANPAGQSIFADSANAELTPASSGYPVDFLVNGFKLRTGGSPNVNGNQATYTYIAFADVPFKQSATPNGYSIPDSLRLNATNYNYLSRTPGTPTSQTKGTISLWVKRGALGTQQGWEWLYGANATYGAIMFDPTDHIRLYDSSFDIYTNQVFRDPSAWVHLVFSFDSTAAAGQRVKGWANNVPLTFQTYNEPALNGIFSLFSSALHDIGVYYPNYYYFDGNIADFYYIDGTALTPASFGAADTNGYWKPKAYTGGNYGTNGFYLNFQNANSLGADASGKGNTFALNGSPALSSTDQMNDTPTDNFATVNQLYSYPAKSTVQAGGLAVYGGYGAYPGWQLNSGKWYWEVTPVSGADGNTINGVVKDANSGFSYHYYPGHSNDTGLGYEATGVVLSNSHTIPSVVSSYNTNDVIGVAYDAGTGKVYFSRNGKWQNGDNLIPQMTGQTTSGVAMTGSSQYSGSYYAWYAGDKNTGTGWYAYPTPPSVAAPQWIRTDFGANPKVVGSYSIQNWSSSGNYDPLDFTLDGSNDSATCSAGNGTAGTVWTTLDTETSVQWTLGYQSQIFSVPTGNQASYRCYRIKVTRSNGNASMLFSEIGLYPETSASPADGTSYTGIVHGGWPGFMNYSYKSMLNFGQLVSVPMTFSFSTPGTYTVPIKSFQTLTVTVQGAGGGGGGESDVNYCACNCNPGGNGGNGSGPTSFNGTVIANQGNGGNGGNNSGANSAPGSASGGDTNTTGGAANGGAGGASGNDTAGTNGGNGGLAVKTYTNNSISGSVTIVIGSGGGGGAEGSGCGNEANGSNGGNGSVTLAYTYTLNTSDPSGGNFAFPPPSGYKALSTNNLPTPAIAQPNQYFDAKAYMGNGGVQSLDPVNKGAYITLANNNFDGYSSTNSYWNNGFMYSTGTFSSGKWYAEFKISGNYPTAVGIGDASKRQTPESPLGSLPTEYSYYPYSSQIGNNGVWTTGYPGLTAGDTVMVAVDMNSGQIWFGKNGTWFGAASSTSPTGTTPQYTGITGTKAFAVSALASAGVIQANFGQAGRIGSSYFSSAGGYFYYQPPAGFAALTSTGGAQNIPLNFQPDLVWIKNRIAAYANTLVDSQDGANFNLFSNSTGAGVANDVNGTVNSFNSAGFTVGGSCAAPSGNVNSQNNSYISWLWKKSPAAGIDIESYGGNGSSTQTISHALGTTPDFAIIKRTDVPGDWYVWTSTLGALGSFLKLDTTDMAVTQDSPFGADLIPVMTGPTTNGVTISASTYYNGSYPPWYVGDKNVGSYWISSAFTAPLTAAAPQWLQVDFGSGNAKTVGAYSIALSSADGPDRAPASFTLQGSNTGAFAGEQTILDTESVSWIYGQSQTFYVPSANQGSYRYYRLNITANGGASYVEASEFNLWPASVVPTATTFTVANQNGGSGLNAPPLGADAIPTMTAATTNGVTMSASSQWSTGYAGWYAGDKNVGSYWNSSSAPTVSVPQWLRVDFGSGNGKTIAAYTITKYNSTSGQYDPINFTLQGSNDANTCSASGTSWTTLDTEMGISWLNALEQKTFFVPAANQTSYRCYQVSTTLNGGNSNQLVIPELNLWQAANGTSQYIAYLFSNREGFSKSGTYVGNGSADGPYVYTGFKPKFVMIKDSSAGNSYTHWNIYDSARNATGNPVLNMLYPDASLVENGDGYCGSANCPVDFLADGFKIRDAGYWNANNSGNTYAYIAFADTPFKQSAGVGPSGYTLPYSLRFNAAVGDYLTHTPTVAASSNTAFTASFWMKRGIVGGSRQWIYSDTGNMDAFGPSDATNIDYFHVRIAGVDSYWGGALRDPSQWIQVVIAVDTTQSTPSNRVRVYFNGIQQSLYTGSYPTQNAVFSLNQSGVVQNIGRDLANAAYYFDGNLADFYMIDGQALTPASFGEYDANGYWRPAAYSGFYGQNGFHLNFSTISYSNFSTGSGSISVGPLYKSSTYKLMCTVPEGGTVSSSQTITVTGAGLRLTACNQAGTSCSSGGTPAYVNTGDSPVLSWSTTGADANSCSVTQSSGAGSTIKTVFTTNGSFLVPTGVSSITVKAWGAGGGSNGSVKTGGGGGFAQGTVTVTPGETLTVAVGGGGQAGTTGGTNGGGSGGSGGNANGGGGGGYTGIFRSTVSQAGALVVAGGGAGVGAGSNTGTGGDGGGLSGTNGTTGSAGLGGTQSAGGANGGSSGSPTNGSALQGGTGGSAASNYSGGGGGGGYYGGGGGAAGSSGAGAGGGGSGFVATASGAVSNATLTAGSGGVVANNGDADYPGGRGNGATNGNGQDGLLVISYISAGTITTVPPANTNSASNVVAPAVSGNTTYTLMCLMNGAPTSATASVTTSQPCTTGVGVAGNSCSSQCIFDTSTAQPQTGTGATLSWCCPAGPSAGGNFSTGGAAFGSAVVTPSSPTAYSLSCGSGGSGTLNLTPTSTAPPPVSMSLTASPSHVRAGGAGTTVLSWTVLGMASGLTCIMTPVLPGGIPAWNGNNPWNGSATTGAISAATLYTLTCGNGTASTSASVNINLVPIIKEI